MEILTLLIWIKNWFQIQLSHDFFFSLALIYLWTNYDYAFACCYWILHCRTYIVYCPHIELLKLYGRLTYQYDFESPHLIIIIFLFVPEELFNKIELGHQVQIIKAPTLTFRKNSKTFYFLIYIYINAQYK